MTPSTRHVSLLAELARARALDENPAASRLWTLAPSELRRQFALGFIDRDSFWQRLEHWLVFAS
jgi:hypothetical protein